MSCEYWSENGKPEPCGGHTCARVEYQSDRGPRILDVCSYHRWWMRRQGLKAFRTLVEYEKDEPLLGPNDRSLE